MVAFLVMAGGPAAAKIYSLDRLLILPQAIESNESVIFGIKIVGQKRCYFKKRT
jgi:hypothetical protein